jgi:hypothetical protein
LPAASTRVLHAEERTEATAFFRLDELPSGSVIVRIDVEGEEEVVEASLQPGGVLHHTYGNGD